MNHIDSDLEEGEILDDDDDSPPSPTVCDKKDKELPRRYVVKDKSNIPKHKKKDCKHAIRYQAKKLSKLKSPVKMKYMHKNHKSSCCEKSHKYSDNHNGCSSVSKKSISKKSNSFSKQSLILEIKSSCKDISKKQSSKPNKSDLLNAANLTKDFSASKVQSVKDLKNSELDKTINEILENSLSGSAHHNQVSIKNAGDFLNKANTKTESPVKSNLPSTNPSEVENEESEDEEELRRIALATFAKRKAVVESPERSIQNMDVSNTSVPDPVSNIDVQILYEKTSNPVSDNYEVIDMDVDDDDQNSVEIIETAVNHNQENECSANLFIIDTNPSADFLGNKENSPSKLQLENNSDDDFQADVLRAELIGKMTRQQYPQNEPAQKSDVSVFPYTKPNHKPIPTLPEKKLLKYQKLATVPTVNFPRKPLRPHKRVLRKNVINKSTALLKANNNKPALPVSTNKPPQRLIIALNEESSSSEDSDNADESSSVAESIVALISDCRQKSDSTEKTKETVEHVPKAVACLSKAQQEEYNSLMKILAEKKKSEKKPAASNTLTEKNPTAPNTLTQKNDSVQSPLDKLKQLEKELVTLKDALKLKKESVTSLSKEINAKKSTYLKAKLSAQHLREQFIAAEKVRKAKLMEWSKAVDYLKLVRKSVSDIENQINKVQNILLPQNNKQS